MSWLLYPYVLNILILTPVGLGMLLGGPEAQRRIFSGKYAESAGLRALLGSLWTATLIVSVIGLFYPVSMSPLLLIQLIYKTLWWVVFVLPRMFSGRSQEVHWPSANLFLFMLLTYPWVMPWGRMFSR
jgi:hypothetical protein